ncbi:hypothetical protein ACI3L3_09210 [Desulfobaculum sp. SPO524]|uniref:hypothetical protein n=1 Tax=Desulfobaculum sp. SPO524 TaxID=3378071 RepID=UPI0038534334
MTKARSGLQTIEGYVGPYSWDENEEIVTVSVITDENREYVVEHSGPGARLLDYVDEYIRAKGAVRKSRDHFSLTVQSFDVIDAPELDDWIEDDDW